MKYSFMLSYTHFNGNRLKYPDNALWLILFIVFFCSGMFRRGGDREQKGQGNGKSGKRNDDIVTYLGVLFTMELYCTQNSIHNC
jgi:hypothetical protein